jgi:hypothetical protein
MLDAQDSPPRPSISRFDPPLVRSHLGATDVARPVVWIAFQRSGRSWSHSGSVRRNDSSMRRQFQSPGRREPNYTMPARVIRLRRDDLCCRCNAIVPRETNASWNPDSARSPASAAYLRHPRQTPRHGHITLPRRPSRRSTVAIPARALRASIAVAVPTAKLALAVAIHSLAACCSLCPTRPNTSARGKPVDAARNRSGSRSNAAPPTVRR